MEHLCRFEEAENLYKDILKDNPNYTDCELFQLFFYLI